MTKLFDIQTGTTENDTLQWVDFCESEFCEADTAEEAIEIAKEIMQESDIETKEIRAREVTKDEFGGLIYGEWIYNF